MPTLRRPVVLLVALMVLAAACTSGDGEDGGTTTSTSTTSPAASVAGALPELTSVEVTTRGGRALVVDGRGREVILRGANFSSLGDYHQASPDHPPTRPPTDADWDQMAANGFNVVRLIVSWSALEPTRGEIDMAYVERIRQAIDSAAARRIYTVVDMHQDAWGKYIASPEGIVCPEGTEPAIGWDGAPEWATITDDATTCRPIGSREGAPAVQAAFRSFYENRDGIRDAFVATWRRLVVALGDSPAIAGYDLLNEPVMAHPAEQSEPLYTELIQATMAEVRAGEAEIGVTPRIVFLEPMVLYPLPGTMPPEGFTTDTQIVFSPHNYAEVIGPAILTVEQTFDVAAQTAADRGWPLWIGEHGVYSVDDERLAIARRFAASQDAGLAGGAQWQWRQWCGDPHAVGLPGRAVTEVQIQLNDVACPDDVDAGPNVDLLAIAGRAYPRSAPGRLTDIESDPLTGAFTVRGVIEDDLGSNAPLVVWVPGTEEPRLQTTGLAEPELVEVDGGWYVLAEVTDSPYEVSQG